MNHQLQQNLVNPLSLKYYISTYYTQYVYVTLVKKIQMIDN